MSVEDWEHLAWEKVPSWIRKSMKNMDFHSMANDGYYHELKGKNYRYKVVASGQGASSIDVFRKPHSRNQFFNEGKRKRATAVVVRDGEILLVRDRGSKSYSLPGGAMESNEPALIAATRELYEETKLEPIKAEFLFEYSGTVNEHRVILVRVDPSDKVELQRKELSGYIWWDGAKDIPIRDHVKEIAERAKVFRSNELPGQIHTKSGAPLYKQFRYHTP